MTRRRRSLTCILVTTAVIALMPPIACASMEPLGATAYTLKARRLQEAPVDAGASANVPVLGTVVPPSSTDANSGATAGAAVLSASVDANSGTPAGGVGPPVPPETNSSAAAGTAVQPVSPDNISGASPPVAGDGAEASGESVPATASTSSGLSDEWTLVASSSDIDPSFFASELDGEAAEGSMYFTFCSIRDGLKNASYLSLREPRLVEGDSLKARELYLLTYLPENKVVIGNAAGDSFWKADTANRIVVPVESENEATKFEMLINKKKDAVVLRDGNLYLRTSHAAVGSAVVLSPFIVARSFFRPWTNAKSLALGGMVLERRRQADSILAERRKAPSPDPVYIAYDLALALLLKRPLTALPIEDVTGSDLAVILDEAITLMTSPSLLPVYQALYPVFTRQLLQDFSLLDWSTVVKATGQMPWQEMINALQQTAHTVKYTMHTSLRALLLAHLQAKDNEKGGGLTVFNAPLVIQTYFSASVNLVWLASQKLKNVTLDQMVDAVDLPTFKNPDDMDSHLTPLPGKVEEYWFTKFVQTNITGFDRMATFPQLALLKYLKPEWVSEHSTIGEGIAKIFLKQVDAAVKKTNFTEIVLLFSGSKANDTMDLVRVASAHCKPAMRISFCVIPQVFQAARNLLPFTAAAKNLHKYPLDMRGISNVDLQEYLTELKGEIALADTIKSILEIKKETTEISDKMFNDLAVKIETSQLELMAKNKQQLLTDAEASYAQVRNASQFKIELGATQVERQNELAKTAYNAAVAVKDEYIKTMEEIGEEAIDQAFRAQVFEIIRTVSAVGQAGQSMMNGDMMGTVMSAMAVKGQFAAVKAKINGVTAAKGMLQHLKDSLPEIENITVSIAEKLPMLANISARARPIVDAADKSKFANETVQLTGDALNMRDWALGTRIGRLKFVFATMASQMCGIVNRPAWKPCVEVLKLNTEYFGNLQASFQASNEVLAALADITAGSTDTIVADYAYQAIVQKANQTDVSIAAWNKHLDESEEKREAARFKIRKQQDTEAAFSTSLVLQSQVAFLQLLFLLCARLTMSDNGRIPDLCFDKVMVLKSLTKEEVNQLLSLRPSQGGSPRESLDVVLPTQPAFPGDTGFLDLTRLMNGQPVPILLPMNNTWLREYGWITESDSIEDSVFFLNKFKLILPPRFTDYKEEVTISVETFGVSDLGPCMAESRMRYMYIPPTKFTTNYVTSSCGAEPIKSPYAACGAPMKELCFQVDGNSEVTEKGLRVPLFTPLMITADFASPRGDGKTGIGYRGLATPLRVKVEPEIFSAKLGKVEASNIKRTDGGGGGGDDDGGSGGGTSSSTGKADAETSLTTKAEEPSKLAGKKDSTEKEEEDKEKDDGERRRRLRQEEGEETKRKRCCPVGKYTRHWKGKKECSACPPGSVSQMGGLFCVYGGGDGGGGDGAKERW